jgi:hypothetical protein
MPDTTHDILSKQREIILSKSSGERFIIGEEAIAFGYMVVENSIRQKNPGISEIDLKIAVFRRYYGNQFTLEETDKIIQSLQNYYTDKKQ